MSNYGQDTPIDFYPNTNGTVDIFWQDRGEAASSWNLTTHTSITDASISATINLPSSIEQSGRFLGVSKKESTNTYFLAYSADNDFAVRDSNGNCEQVNGSSDNCNGAFWITGFSTDGFSDFDTLIFGNVDLTVSGVHGETTKGNPGQASTGVLSYHETTDKVVIYAGHKQRWSDDVRHQAVWLGTIDSVGTLDTAMSGWYSSHNFDQRILLASDDFIYTLAHGDAFPRSLQLGQWDITALSHNYTLEYYEIENGSTGSNTTLTDTGTLAELGSGVFAVAFATEDNRDSRDVRLQVISGVTSNTTNIDTDVWLTEYNNLRMAANGIKVASAGDEHIIVAWNAYQGSTPDNSTATGDYVNTTIALYDLTGELVDSMTLDDQLLPTQPFRQSADGNSVIWVTASENAELIIHSIDISAL
ncbi:hypothetical protein [Thalassotalea eurytherma]|uniref:WD40 repeat domain-containing protein n=1 Tax=Thalassotalea eurytherma TaxID=1144278 RepID=A0ABQ6H028_9GAMM|nr:hypothetical protein [Thalassotalea eurytherma]GLX81462.1 hypothetical protein theurythT_09140 [Thalassotalea eurytherma]